VFSCCCCVHNQRRDLQFSSRRGLGLSDTYSRSSERCSLKRDGVEVAHVERDFSSRRGVYGF